MPEQGPPPTPEQRMLNRVAARQKNMLRGRTESKGDWSAIRLLGVVGWSVAVPTLLGIAAGIWIDRRWPGRIPWTITLLFAGLILGCASAWQHLRGDR